MEENMNLKIKFYNNHFTKKIDNKKGMNIYNQNGQEYLIVERDYIYDLKLSDSLKDDYTSKVISDGNHQCSFIVDFNGIDNFIASKSLIFNDYDVRELVIKHLNLVEGKFKRFGASGSRPSEKHPGGEVVELQTIDVKNKTGCAGSVSGYLDMSNNEYSKAISLSEDGLTLREERTVYSHTIWIPENSKPKNVSKVYKINKRKSGLFGAVLNLFAPRYEKKIAVSDMNFSIEEGEAVAFIGSNGAGKSTTIKMLSGILYPSEGEITVASYVPYKQRKKYVSNIGVVLGQKSQLVWDLPVRDGYELIRHIYKISKEDYEKRLDEFIEMLDMKEFINQPVRQLSLGQKMRAEIVATMLHNPKIIFLDEPTIGLDLVAKKKIQDFIRTINKKYNVTIIFTTHDMQDIVSTCERLIIIDKGKKIYDGAVKNVKELCDDVKILRVEMAQGEKVSNDGLLNIKECDENIVEIMFEKPKLQLERVSKYLNDNYLVKSIRPMSSEQDILEVVTKDSQMIVDTTIYESEKIHDNHFRIKLKDVNTQLGATLNKFVTEYDIKDVLIKEPEISEIVYNIYEGKVELKK